jgi:hypothetical protein
MNKMATAKDAKTAAIKLLIQREEGKLARQQGNHEATVVEYEVLDQSQKVANKLEAQKKAIAETEANLKKLRAAIK